MSSYPIKPKVPKNKNGKEFYNHNQAKVIAETYYNIDKNLYDSVVPKLLTNNPQSEDIWQLYLAFVNFVLSCEITLKLFYKNEYGHLIQKHKLYSELLKKCLKKCKILLWYKLLI